MITKKSFILNLGVKDKFLASTLMLVFILLSICQAHSEVVLPLLAGAPPADLSIVEESLETPLPTPELEESAQGIPSFISLAQNVNDFGQFADGGPDSNWFIGFNNAWIVELPPAPAGNFRHAFIGAKIGRAKTSPKPDKPWELSVIKGEIYMAISQTPSFSPEQSFFLADTKDIPLEANDKVYMRGTGSSQWFWAEIPTNRISSTQPNYLIIWSPTREFKDAAHAPILAALEAALESKSEPPSAWNNHSIQGVPPRSESQALQVPINIRPALAIKLAPTSSQKIVVENFSVHSLADSLLAQGSVVGKDIDLVWIEFSTDQLEWQRISSYLRHPPYLFTLPRSLIPSRGGYLRARARDLMGSEAASKEIFASTYGAR